MASHHPRVNSSSPATDYLVQTQKCSATNNTSGRLSDDFSKEKSMENTSNNTEPTVVGFQHLPCVLVSLIESFLPASSICSLSSTSRQNRERWTALRWKLTFKLHYIWPLFDDGVENFDYQQKHDQHQQQPHYAGGVQDRWSLYHRKRFGEWEKSFVGCCCNMCENTNIIESDTQFNVSALVPSLMRAYGNLWDRIELSMLGYNDIVLDEREIRHVHVHSNQMNNGWDLNIITSGLAIISKVVNLLFEPFLQYATFFSGKAQEKKDFPRHYAMRLRHIDLNSMCAWKLACLLRENGVDCLRCRLCDKIDVMNKHSSLKIGKEGAWMTPCRCCEPVHRKCLEERLDLKQKLHTWERAMSWCQITTDGQNGSIPSEQLLAPKMWVSYDSPTTVHESRNQFHPACVNHTNQFMSPNAKCMSCGETYERDLRLPRNISEVVFSSLSDPLAIARAFSTFSHFLLCVFCIATIEAKCDHKTCENNVIFWDRWIPLSWPLNRTWKAMALAWWQLQQCCMLHILFSPRFVAIVDQLWAHSISIFYVRLYIYFVLTSFVLAISFLPLASRMFHDRIVTSLLKEEYIYLLSPVWDFVAVANLINYAISSTTVIVIFWRTNYRVYTVANRVKHADNSAGAMRNRNQIESWNEHPIYHGHWR